MRRPVHYREIPGAKPSRSPAPQPDLRPVCVGDDVAVRPQRLRGGDGERADNLRPDHSGREPDAAAALSAADRRTGQDFRELDEQRLQALIPEAPVPDVDKVVTRIPIAQGTLVDLHKHLLAASNLELWTIPLYLTALASIQSDESQILLPARGAMSSVVTTTVTRLIVSVALQEMYHLQLAGNLARLYGVAPKLDWPAYDGRIPYVEKLPAGVTVSPRAGLRRGRDPRVRPPGPRQPELFGDGRCACARAGRRLGRERAVFLHLHRRGQHEGRRGRNPRPREPDVRESQPECDRRRRQERADAPGRAERLARRPGRELQELERRLTTPPDQARRSWTAPSVAKRAV